MTRDEFENAQFSFCDEFYNRNEYRGDDIFHLQTVDFGTRSIRDTCGRLHKMEDIELINKKEEK